MAMTRRSMITAAILAAGTALTGAASWAQDAAPFKIGLILPMTGPFASTGRQIETAARLYMSQHGDTVAGRKIELIVQDDAGTADTTVTTVLMPSLAAHSAIFDVTCGVV